MYQSGKVWSRRFFTDSIPSTSGDISVLVGCYYDAWLTIQALTYAVGSFISPLISTPRISWKNCFFPYAKSDIPCINYDEATGHLIDII